MLCLATPSRNIAYLQPTEACFLQIVKKSSIAVTPGRSHQKSDRLWDCRFGFILDGLLVVAS